MEADTLDLHRIFRKDCRYLVPTFQRPYVWNEEEHWQIFWHDLRKTVDALLQLRNTTESDEPDSPPPLDEVPPWFLGAIVLDQVPTSTGKIGTRSVIDGQQRLTTLQMLFAAIRFVAGELSQDAQVKLIEKLMYNDADLVKSDDHQFKVWPIKTDQDAYREVMARSTDGSNPSVEGTASKKLIACFEYFVDEVREWATAEEETASERIDALTSALWDLVKLVVIDLAAEDDAQVIFETLNARGTPLLAADLIKNRLFRQIEREGQPTDELYERYWEQFDEEEWRSEVRQGRLERPRIDVFIMHWLTMRKADRVAAKELYPAFRDYLTWSGVTIHEVLEDIVHYADVYDGFSDPYPDGRDGLFFERLEVMEATTPFPVLLWMYGRDTYPSERRTLAVEAIESWMVRRMLCRLTTKNYNRIFLQLLERLQGNPDDPLDVLVSSFLQEKEGESDFWPTDEAVAEAMVTLPYWARINQQRLKMVFRAIERELRSTGYSEGLEISEQLHIEHIMPQTWAHHWSLPGERPEAIERMERDEAKQTIGNLTVLTQKLNSSASNAPWAKKRAKIDEHSVLRLNRRLVQTYPERWDESTISERGRWLAGLATNIWPGPDSPYWHGTPLS